jgi:acetylornithine deacetylase/succinyl-diaminopimelate desuccinylase-like protein
VRAEVTALLQRLIACDTSNPPGREAQAAAVIEDYLSPYPITCRRIASDEARPNLIATLPGRGTGPTLAFLGHLDVVPARRQDWALEPFAGIARDGAVWGRGTIDMKCQVAASTVALATLARERFVPNGDLMLILAADEEVGEAGIGAPFLVQQLPDLRLDYVIGEGAGERFETPRGPIYLLSHGVKATAAATLTVHGDAADASLPGNGTSAAYESARLLRHLEQYDPPPQIHPAVIPLLDYLAPDEGDEIRRVAQARASNPALDLIVAALVANVISATTIDGGGPKNAVLDEARVNLNCTLLPGTTRDALEAELRTALGNGRYTLQLDEPQGGSISPTDTLLQHAIEDFLRQHDPDARLIPTLAYGYSDCHTLRQAYGATTYGFIPFRHASPLTNLTITHGADEHVLIEDLVFQLEAAIHVARTVGSTTVAADAAGPPSHPDGPEAR